ncbi:hypothetical protein [Burkholderia multivorans]|uniref:hypothetical protein n=1 Tax=Burkholderia multivorans TaxID=87883 RepID=UPI0011B23B71|nr:hypothetical protein [Burkholderia multivorans]
MHAKKFAQGVHDVIAKLTVQRSVLHGCPTLLSPAVSDAALALRRAATELKILAVDMLNGQRQEAGEHRDALGDGR